MTIDVHTHAFPDAIAQRTIAKLAPICGVSPAHNGTVDGLLQTADAGGIDLSLLLPVVTKPSQFDSVNRFAIQQNRHPKLRSFGGIHPDCDNIPAKLAFIKQAGLRGIKIHPDYQGVFIDDPRYISLIREAIRLDLYVLTHAGLDPLSPDCIHCSPHRAAAMLNQVYEGKNDAPPRIIFAHMGGAGMGKDLEPTIEAVEQHLCSRNVYFDTAFMLPCLPGERAVALIRRHGSEKILFGSDSPWGNPKALLQILCNLPLTEAEKQCILFENAAKILGLSMAG